jgi:dipeptidyl aminopeptidase/acylaminoacyl peptidase
MRPLIIYFLNQGEPMKNLWLLPFLTATLLVAQPTLPLGEGPTKIGVLKSYGEHWKPLFFAVDSQRNYHIPDFYKNRIVLFDHEGRFLQAIPTEGGLTPRMNIFLRNDNGQYLSFSDSALYILSPEGKILWTQNFGLGFIPRQILFSESMVQVLPSGSRGKVFLFNAADGTFIGSPVIESPEGKEITYFVDDEHRYSYEMKDMPLLREGWSQNGEYENYKLFRILENGQALWIKSIGLSNAKRVVKTSAAGEVLTTVFLSSPSSFPAQA